MAGAILSVTVPATSSRSAWRGPCANGMTPNRMKSCFDVEMNLAVTYQLVKQPITCADFADTQFAGECP